LALSGSRTPNAISCPRFVQALPKAVPTLPAPMIAIFINDFSFFGSMIHDPFIIWKQYGPIAMIVIF
jgi:hypothetical protein